MRRPPPPPHAHLPPRAGISSLHFSPQSDLLVASSWNNSVYVWDVQAATGQSVPKAANKDHQQPVLCTAWNQDGTQVGLECVCGGRVGEAGWGK